MDSQLSQSVYYGYTSYTEFTSGSSILATAGSQLSLRFRFCSPGGLLLSASGSDEQQYFNVGIDRSGQLIVEFTINADKYQVIKGLNKSLFVY